MRYQIWAITEYGEGRVQSLGIVEDPTEIVIYPRMFADDVVINVEECPKEYDLAVNQSDPEEATDPLTKASGLS